MLTSVIGNIDMIIKANNKHSIKIIIVNLFVIWFAVIHKLVGIRNILKFANLTNFSMSMVVGYGIGYYAITRYNCDNLSIEHHVK